MKLIFRRLAKINRVWSILLLLIACSARSQEITSTFVVSNLLAPTNGMVSLWLYEMNNTDQPQAVFLPQSLAGTLSSAIQTNVVNLTLNTNDAPLSGIIPGGKFLKLEYLLAVPAGMQGQLRLEVNGYNPMLVAVAGENLPNTITNLPLITATTSPTNTPGKNQLGGDFAHFLSDHISPYEPIYFLLGSYPAAKFQFSLKYHVFLFTGAYDPLAYLYFAYTQTSFWDLINRDPSFYDTSYKPSAFLYYTNIPLAKLDAKLDLQAGMQHESNGRGGLQERSLNTVYFQPTLKYSPVSDLTFSLQPRFWYYLSVGDNNPDLANYRGYGDVSGSVRWQDIEFATMLQMGKDWNHAGWQFDLRFNLPKFLRFNPALQVEYFTGYGESLRQYNQTSHSIRAGLCLWY